MRVRGRALLVGVDAVRFIAAADEVYVLSAPTRGRLQHAVAATTDNAFVRDLLFRLRAPPAALLGAGWCALSLNLRLCVLCAGRSPPCRVRLVPSPDPRRDTDDAAVDRSLPFELRALEGALATVARLLAEEAATLEAHAVPAADRLAKRVRSPQPHALLSLSEAKSKGKDKTEVRPRSLTPGQRQGQRRNESEERAGRSCRLSACLQAWDLACSTGAKALYRGEGDAPRLAEV